MRNAAAEICRIESGIKHNLLALHYLVIDFLPALISKTMKEKPVKHWIVDYI
jgi:hypothetical protein